MKRNCSLLKVMFFTPLLVALTAAAGPVSDASARSGTSDALVVSQMQEIAERDFTRALELELPRAATSIRLSPTTDRYQSCVIGFDDGKTTEATFKPDALSDSVLFAFATRDPVDKFRAAVGARGVSAAQMRAIVRQCVKSGILYDRYHSSPI